MIRSRERIYTDVEIDFIRTNYKAMGNSELAERLGRSEVSVRSMISRLMLLRRVDLNDYLSDIQDMHNAGKAVQDIAEFCGVSRETLLTFLRKKGMRK